MAEKKKNQEKFSTCLEGTPLAEMMQKMSGQQGIGSLCAEMMKKVMEKPGGRLHGSLCRNDAVHDEKRQR